MEPKTENSDVVANTVNRGSLNGMRVELWRQGNRDRYNERQKLLMRAKRAKLKLEKEKL